MAQTLYPGVAAITGAASGVGRSAAIAFAREGCTQIALLDRDEAGLEETRKLASAILISQNKKVSISSFKTDVSSEQSVLAAYKAIRDQFGRIDYAVNGAGLGAPDADTINTSTEVFDHHIGVNFRGLWLCVREVLKIMHTQPLDSEAYPEANIASGRAQRGSVINIASTVAVSAIPSVAAYTAAKGGVIALTRADAIDCVKYQIRVNVVLPGMMDTPMTGKSVEMRDMLEEKILPFVPMRRMGKPEEIADVCVFLAGNKASFVTGQAWASDGGFLAGIP